MRLIDADALVKRIKYSSHDYERIRIDTVTGCLLTDFVSPTVDPVHAAGAVYCKECKYCEQNCKGQTNETSYKCTKYSFYDFSNRQPNDFCSQGTLKLPLQEEISTWLIEKAFFADSVSEIEFIMQKIYFDNPKYEGKEEDQKEIANNCKTVADAYYYVQTHELNVDKIYKRK